MQTDDRKNSMLITAALGLASGAILIGFSRTLEFLMLVNFTTQLQAAACLLALAFGFVDRRNHKKIARGYSLLFSAAIVTLIWASLTNRDFTSLALGSAIYYPVPLPRGGLTNQIALAIVMFGGPLFFYPLGSHLAQRLHGSTKRLKTFSGYWFGFAAGAAIVYIFSYLSPFLWLTGALVLYAFALLRPRYAVTVAIFATSIYSYFAVYPARTFFAWGITEFEYLGGGFGRDVKTDFISFFDDDCVGTVIDNAMMTCECKDLSWIPAEYDYILRTIIDPYDPPPSKYHLPATEPVSEEKRDIVFDVLDVGRSGGGNCRALEIYTGPNNNATIEFDPAIAERLLNDHSEYNHGFYHREGSRVFTGDFRTHLEDLIEAGEKFDFLFLSGIGTKTYILPRSYIFSEHFLLTREGTDLIYNRLLKPGGLFYLDWGSSSPREGKWFVASFPSEVSTIVYWTTQSEYPFSGSPQVYAIASLDRKKIATIEKRLDRLTGFMNVDFTPNIDDFITTDNRPFLQNDMQAVLAFFHTLFSLLMIFVLRAFSRRTFIRWDIRSRTGGGSALLLGIAAGFAESMFACYNPFILGPFGIPPWTILHILFLFGLAAGFAAPISSGKASRFAPPILFAVGSGLLFSLTRSPFVFTTSFIGASAFGIALRRMLNNKVSPTFFARSAFFLFGGSWALVINHAPFYLGGYTFMAAVSLVMLILNSYLSKPVKVGDSTAQ